METTLSKDVQEKLDMINWDSLKDKYGISRDSFYTNPHLASQLAYGQMTDLVFAGKDDFSGMLSLRANMDTSGEKPEMKEALLERGEWIGPDGKKTYGNLKVNGGRPISINLDGKKQQFLASIHQPTNRVVGMSVDSVRSFFFDKDNNLRGKGMYGVPFTAEQANALIEGKAVVHSGQR